MGRRLLFATTALTGLAIGSLGMSPNASAACTPDVVFNNETGQPLTASTSASSQITGGSGNAFFVGAIGGDGTFNNNCVIEIVNSDDNTISIETTPATTTHTDAIVIDDDSTRTTIQVANVLGSFDFAIRDGAGRTTVNVVDGGNIAAKISLGDGADTLNLGRGLITGGSTVEMGAGNDSVFINDTSWNNSGRPVVDGGAGDNDTIEYSYSGVVFRVFSDGEFTNVSFLNFEHFVKSGTGLVELESDAGGDSFTSVTLREGRLDLRGTWTIGTVTNVSSEALTVLTDSTLNVGEINNSGFMAVFTRATVNASGLTSLDGGSLFLTSNSSTFNADGGLMGGDGNEVIRSFGTLNITGVADLGGGDDLVVLLTGMKLNGTIDGGGDIDGDTLEFSGSGPSPAQSTHDFANGDLINFERLVKTGNSIWTLIATPAGKSFETLTVDDGRLILVGNWSFTGNTTMVNAGSRLDIGDGSALTVTNDAGNADIAGRLDVTNNATFNVAGTTTVFDGGRLNVNTGGAMSIGNLDIQTGGTVNVDGTLVGTALANIVTVSGTLDAAGQTIELLAGADEVILNAGGTLNADLVDLGADNDKATIDNGAWDASARPTFDGGDDTDTIEFSVAGPVAAGFTGGSFTSLYFLNFENLIKTGDGLLSLGASGGGDAFEAITVAEGGLQFRGSWTITDTATVMAGANLEIGPSASVNVDGNTIIDGTLRVLVSSTYNSGDASTDTTTIGDGGVLEIQVTGVYNAAGAINGSDGINTISILGGTLNAAGQTIDLMGGADVVSVSGAISFAQLNLGDGDDMLTLTSGGSFNGAGIGGIDAGGNDGAGDMLILNGTVDQTLGNMGSVVNFEHLVKNGANAWTLSSDTGTATFETLSVDEGVLTLIGNWSFTGNTTTVMPATTLNIGDGSTLTVTNEAGDTNVSGTLNVTNNATFNSGVGAGDVTTVFDGGTINVNTGAMPGVLNAQAVEVQSGGAINVDGMMTATDTTIAGIVTVSATGTYGATGNTLLENGGNLNVAGGTYNGGDDAGDTTTVNNSAITVTMGGTYIAAGTTTVNAGGGVVVGDTSAGTYTAQALILDAGAFFVGNSGIATAAGATSVTGNGFLNIQGTGMYTANGTTTLTVGFIQVSDGGTYVAAAATVVNGGFLQVSNGTFEANDSTTVNGGTLRVSDGGNYTANGVTTITGGILGVTSGGTYTANAATNINGGILEIRTGAFYTANAAIDINGGTVQGFGTIAGGQVMSNLGGAVTPGFGLNSIGTLFFVGTYNQHAGGAFQADIQPGGMSDLLLINGSAALGGAVQINTIAANFAPGDRFRIMQTNVPIPTIFDSAAISGAGVGGNVVWVGRVNDAGLFDVDDPSTGNNVDVLFAVNPANQPNLTPNQAAVAAVVGGAIADLPPGTIVIEDPGVYLATMVAAAGPNALDQIGGEVYDSFTAFSFNIARQFGGLVDTRVRTLRCASAAGPSAPFCGSGRTLLSQDNQQLADAGPGLDPGAAGTVSPRGFSPNTHPYGWSVWAQAIGSYISLDQTSTNLGYSGWTGGGAMGVDLALSQRWIVGVLAGGTRSNIDFSGVSGDGDLDAVTVGVYTAWYGSRWFANAAFTYTKTWVEADRDLTFMAPATTAKGKTEGDQYAIHSTIGYGFKLRRFSLEATGGVDWVQLRQYGFTETGAGAFNLTVGSRTDDSLRLRAGIRVARAWRVRPNLIISPSLRVGYAREVLDNTRAITSTLAGFGGSFTVNGDEGSRNILTYGGGIQADFSQGITIYFRHSGEWAGDRTGHTFNGGIKVRW